MMISQGLSLSEEIELLLFLDEKNDIFAWQTSTSQGSAEA
jgi:hypothetical protein